MLSTLLKYEMKATGKTFMWLYIAFIVISALNAILIPWGGGSGATVSVGSDAVRTAAENTVPSVLQVILVALYFMAIAAIAIGTLVIVIIRFYRNLLGDEGYLMLTLPVSREQHILSKLLVAVLWSFCSIILIILSILLLIATSGSFGDLADGINEAIRMGAPVGQWIAMLFALLIAASFSSVLMLYAAMAVGPNLVKNRVAGSILAFIIIYVVSQIVMAAITFTTVTPMGLSIMSAQKNEADAAASSVLAAFMGALIGSVVIGVVCWFLTRYMLKRKLNLA